jgi:peptide deformylase
MRLKIVQAGDAVLRQRGKDLAASEIRSSEIQNLIEWMRDTMHDKPENLKDLSAGYLKERERKPVPFQVLVNPKLTLQGPADVEFFEGCLSLAGFTAVVPRARKVRVECLDHQGEPKTIEASGWYARILQHEIDHLDGAVYIDRMRTRTFMSVENYNRFWKNTSSADLRKLIGWEG